VWDWIEKAAELRSSGIPFVIATVVETKGSVPRGAGAKIIVTRDAFFGTVGGGQLEARVIEDAHAAMARAEDARVPYPLCFKTGQCCGGSVEVLFEVLGLGPELYIFGAGHVGQALARTLHGTPFAVHLVDARPEWLNHPELPKAVHRHGGDWRAFLAAARWSRTQTYAVVMTHEHSLDEEIVAELVVQPARYLGLIGSDTKWQRFVQRLRARGLEQDLIDRVVCPVGAPSGGKAPQEIAINLAADLLNRHYQS